MTGTLETLFLKVVDTQPNQLKEWQIKSLRLDDRISSGVIKSGGPAQLPKVNQKFQNLGHRTKRYKNSSTPIWLPQNLSFDDLSEFINQSDFMDRVKDEKCFSLEMKFSNRSDLFIYSAELVLKEEMTILNFKKYQFVSVIYGKNDDDRFYPFHLKIKPIQLDAIIEKPDGTFSFKTQTLSSGTTYKPNMARLMGQKEDFAFGCKCITEFIENLSNIYRDYRKYPIPIPLTINDVIGYHTPYDLLDNHYKGYDGFSKGINKQSLALTYLEKTVAKKIDPRLFSKIQACFQQNRKQADAILLFLQDAKDDWNYTETDILYPDFVGRNTKRKIAYMILVTYCVYYQLKGFVPGNLTIDKLYKAFDWRMLYDAIYMSLEIKHPIDFSKHSNRALENWHDDILYTYQLKMEKKKAKEFKTKFKFKKKYKPLITHLSKNRKFKLLDAPIALSAEGIKQKNCVGSYSNKVKSGDCIIYHATINSNPYTIEFTMTDLGQFRNIQMFGKHNCYPEKDDQLFVEEILKEVNGGIK